MRPVTEPAPATPALVDVVVELEALAAALVLFTTFLSSRQLGHQIADAVGRLIREDLDALGTKHSQREDKSAQPALGARLDQFGLDPEHRHDLAVAEGGLDGRIQSWACLVEAVRTIRVEAVRAVAGSASGRAASGTRGMPSGL
jgi:hypothetical protein